MSIGVQPNTLIILLFVVLVVLNLHKILKSLFGEGEGSIWMFRRKITFDDIRIFVFNIMVIVVCIYAILNVLHPLVEEIKWYLGK